MTPGPNLLNVTAGTEATTKILTEKALSMPAKKKAESFEISLTIDQLKDAFVRAGFILMAAKEALAEAEGVLAAARPTKASRAAAAERCREIIHAIENPLQV